MRSARTAAMRCVQIDGLYVFARQQGSHRESVPCAVELDRDDGHDRTRPVCMGYRRAHARGMGCVGGQLENSFSSVPDGVARV